MNETKEDKMCVKCTKVKQDLQELFNTDDNLDYTRLSLLSLQGDTTETPDPPLSSPPQFYLYNLGFSHPTGKVLTIFFRPCGSKNALQVQF